MSLFASRSPAQRQRPARWLALGGIVACHVASALESCEPFQLSAERVARLGHVRADAKRVDFTPKPKLKGAHTLRAGDTVVVWWTDGDTHCASALGKKQGDVATGWLPAASLDVDPVPPPPPAADWAGSWERDADASIEIKAVGADKIAVSGEAEWVPQGGVPNLGSIDRTIVPVAGALLRFATDDGDVADERGACVVTMQRLDSWLLVHATRYCSGFNVTFDGIYTR